MRMYGVGAKALWAATLLGAALVLAPAPGHAAWRGGGARQPSAPQAGAQAHGGWGGQSHGGGGGGGCAQYHVGGGWRGRSDGDHDRDDRAFHGGGHRVHSGGEVFLGVGPGWWGTPDPGWWYPPPVYDAGPPVVTVEPPQEYVQQQPSGVPDDSGAYWYYCPSAEAYYPTVTSCDDPWVKVRPRSP